MVVDVEREAASLARAKRLRDLDILARELSIRPMAVQEHTLRGGAKGVGFSRGFASRVEHFLGSRGRAPRHGHHTKTTDGYEEGAPRGREDVAIVSGPVGACNYDMR